MSGKFQKKEEGSAQIIVESIKPVENSNIVTISIEKELKFEKLVALKDMLGNFKGSDPLIFKVNNNNEETKVLVSPNFWTNASNDLTQAIERNFKEELSISISSLE